MGVKCRDLRSYGVLKYTNNGSTATITVPILAFQITNAPVTAFFRLQ